MKLQKMFLFAVAVLAVRCTTTPTAEPYRDLASEDFPFLTYEQVKTLPSTQVYEFYKKLYVMMEEIERFQDRYKNDPGYKPQDSAFWRLMFSESHANTETLPPYKSGNDCLIGGYWGQWGRSPVSAGGSTSHYRMSCSSPNRCPVLGDKGNQKSGHMCNPKFFTYANTEGRVPFCADIRKDLTQSGCIAKVEEGYNRMCPKDKKQYCRPFADHFRRSLLTAIEADAKFNGVSPTEAMRKYKEEIFGEYARIHKYCGPTPKDWNRHNAGQNFSCFRLLAMYNDIERVIAENDPNYKPGPAPVPAPVPGPVPVPVPVPQPKPIGPGHHHANADLGKFSCIKRGLQQAGHGDVSDKFIAMLAVEAKHREDAFANIKTTREVNMIRSTILTLTAVGYCKQNDYGFNGHDAGRVKKWLNAEPLTDVDNDEYEKIFGIKRNYVMTHSPPSDWSNLHPFRKRQSWVYWARSSAPGNCTREMSAQQHAEMCRAMFESCNQDLHRPAVDDTGLCERGTYNPRTNRWYRSIEASGADVEDVDPDGGFGDPISQ